MKQAIRLVTGVRASTRAGHPRRSSLLLIAAAALVAGAIWGGAASPAGAADDRRPTVAPAHERNAGGRVGRAHGGRGSRFYRGYHRGFYRPSFYSSWYWPGYYRPYGAYLGYGDGGYWGSYYRPDAGALDLDVRPEEASIYLDGELIGIADNYDGWPRYLWLREGSYRMVIYHEGYETLAREVRIRPGEIISLKDRMQAGPSKRPEELFAEADRARSPATRRAPAAEDRRAPYREQDRRDRPSQPPRREPPRAADTPERDWRDRERTPAPPVAADQRSDPARLRLVVAPADAVVYLDGRLLGSGEELGRLHSDLIVDPGTHSIEVARPGYRTYSIELELEAGEERELRAELEPQR